MAQGPQDCAIGCRGYKNNSYFFPFIFMELEKLETVHQSLDFIDVNALDEVNVQRSEVKDNIKII